VNKFIYKPNLSLREIRDINSGEIDKYMDKLQQLNKIRKQSGRDAAIEKQNFYDQVRYKNERHIKKVWLI